jgi:hypothetical protein
MIWRRLAAWSQLATLARSTPLTCLLAGWTVFPYVVQILYVVQGPPRSRTMASFERSGPARGGRPRGPSSARVPGQQ